MASGRRFPIGVELSVGGAHARVWAPAARAVEFVTEPTGGAPGATHPLAAEANGYFSADLPLVRAGTRYRLRLDAGDALPDPASRYQPDGPHGPSEVVDPFAYAWGDANWRGARIERQVLYEMHIGTFTQAGTFRGAIERLPDLVDIGVTVLELMPVADFAGRFGWGYDGVNLFAPSRLYGTPNDLRAFVDQAHRLELAVILDVVYNHVGPDGNYLPRFAERYFSDQPTDWGAAINFDGEQCKPVREYFLTNAAYWIDEFHFDGLRIDATQQIFDCSEPHIIAEIGIAARAAARGRDTIVIAENEPQRSILVRPLSSGGCQLDALWNDDFQHSMLVALTGRAEAYYSGYRGVAQEFVSAAKYGFLLQGQRFAWQGNPRGTPALDLAPTKFVQFIENHDQVANSARGERLHALTSAARLRAATALLLLLPQTPMLFQGQEFGASAPFLYFADHTPELAAQVRAGRVQFLAQFASLTSPEAVSQLADPSDPLTFVGCKLDWTERREHTPVVALHRDLLQLRREDPVFRAQRQGGLDGAVLGESIFALRFFDAEHGDRLVLVNLAAQFGSDRGDLLEPLIAPPAGASWRVRWSSEDPAYGGAGTPALDAYTGEAVIPAECVIVMVPSDARA